MQQELSTILVAYSALWDLALLVIQFVAALQLLLCLCTDCEIYFTFITSTGYITVISGFPKYTSLCCHDFVCVNNIVCIDIMRLK